MSFLKLKVYANTAQKPIVYKMIPVDGIDKEISIREFIRAESKSPDANVTFIKSGEECDFLALLDSPMKDFFEYISDESPKKMIVSIAVLKLEHDSESNENNGIPGDSLKNDNEYSETTDPNDDEQDEIGMANEKEEKSVNEEKPVSIKRETVHIEDSPPAPKRARGSDIEQAEAKKRQEFLQKTEAVLIRHRKSVFKLLAESTARGEEMVPYNLISCVRDATRTQLLSLSLRRFTGKSMSEAEISAKINNAESAEVKQFAEHMKQKMHKKS